jgi:NADH-quinone oxidoreductase subunit H
MVCGTMNLVTIAEMQAGLFTNWLIFNDPFTFVVFWVFFTCAMASVNRAPFDLAEAESELVAGFHTEYSGLRWSIFFMAEYGSMFVVSGLATILFFGGWNGPIPVTHVIHNIFVETWGVSLGGWSPFWHYLANLVGCLSFIFKSVLGVTLMMWVRWTLPRLRIDQVITMCWKYCVPITAICFVGVVCWQYQGIRFINDLFPLQQRGAVRENWVEASEDGSETPADDDAGPRRTSSGTLVPRNGGLVRQVRVAISTDRAVVDGGGR